MKNSKQQPEAGSPDAALSEEELGKVSGGNREQPAEKQINIGDLPNVRVDITPM